MINITIYDNGFEIEGHAGYAQKGSDIICAAVSALSQTCRISITELAGYEPVCVEKRKHFATVCFWGILYCSVLIGYFIPV